MGVSVALVAVADLMKQTPSSVTPTIQSVAQKSSQTRRNEGSFLFGVLTNDSGEVLRIIPGSPAEKVGIQQGDRIVRVDGRNVADNPATLDALAPTYYRASLTVTVASAGGEKVFRPTAAGRTEILRGSMKSIDSGSRLVSLPGE